MTRAFAGLLLASAAAAAPCDILAASAPCVGAFSTLRALFSAYAGDLYTIQRASDNATLPIGLLRPGGWVNTSGQDAFCAGSSCVIYRILDQSNHSNDLLPAPPGGTGRHFDHGVNASRLPVTLPDGSRGFGALFESGKYGVNQGYRIDVTNGVAQGNNAETIYMVTSGSQPEFFDNHCCMDFGNAEKNNLDTGEGSMEAVCVLCGEREEASACACSPPLPTGILGPITRRVRGGAAAAWARGRGSWLTSRAACGPAPTARARTTRRCR